MTSKLIIDEPPLQVIPSLAVLIGLNEAIVLQQIHFRLRISKNERDGYRWVYNTQAEWQEQFPFWSLATVKRTLASLRDKGLIVTDAYNRSPFDRTTWYRIDYDKLRELSSSSECAIAADADEPLQEVELPSSSIQTKKTSKSSEEEVLHPSRPLAHAVWTNAIAARHIPDKPMLRSLVPVALVDGVLTLRAGNSWQASQAREKWQDTIVRGLAGYGVVDVRIVTGSER